jgi:hypothetical protein
MEVVRILGKAEPRLAKVIQVKVNTNPFRSARIKHAIIRGGRMDSRLCITLLRTASFAVLLGTAGAEDNRILGQWSSGTFEGMNSVVRRECTAVGVTERKIRLNFEPGTKKVEGEWVRWTRSMWMNTDNRSCRWSTEATQFEPLYQATVVYLLNGEFDKTGTVLKIHGEFAKCDGNACSRWKASSEMSKPFDTELTMMGSKLVDLNGKSDPRDGTAFVRVSDQADEVEEANSTLERYLKMIDAGEIDRFYDNAISSGFRSNTTRQQFKAVTSEFQTRVGRTTSRRNLNTLYLLYVPSVSKASGEYLFVFNGVETSKKLTGAEFALLIKENGEWKVYWINYAS